MRHNAKNTSFSRKIFSRKLRKTLYNKSYKIKTSNKNIRKEIYMDFIIIYQIVTLFSVYLPALPETAPERSWPPFSR